MKALAAALALAVIAVIGPSERADSVTPLLVAVEPGAASLLESGGAEPVAARLRLWRLSGRSSRDLLPRLRHAGLVRAVEPEYPRRRLDYSSGDPLLPGEWWLRRIGAAELEAPTAGVPVTVVDSGVDVAHPEFAGRPGTVLLNAQTTSGTRGFHGTAVASVLGAPANGVGLIGVHPTVELRSWDASPSGFFTSGDVVAGIEAAAALGRGVINLSIGGTSRSRFEQDAIEHAFARGAIVVAAGGNERTRGSPPSYPASLPHVVTVGATDSTDGVAPFSSASNALDLVAPGDGIVAAVPVSHDESGYSTVAGTSFAAPMVSAAVAWLWSERPELEKTQVVELLRRTAIDLRPRGRDVDTGFGLLDLRAALTAAAPPVDPLEPNDGALALDETDAITNARRPAATLRARLDVEDDPRDGYVVWLPARRRTLVRVAQPPARVLLLGRAGRGVSAQMVRGGIALDNRSGLGRFIQANVFLPLGTVPTYVDYRLMVATTRLRPAR